MADSPKNNPKPFMIRCHYCRWGRTSTGAVDDLDDLHEIKSNCKSCGKWRKFRCPNCGRQAIMKRIGGNVLPK